MTMAAWSELSLFLKVVESGSVTAAAEQLGTAKSAVSTRIARFEAEVGVRLLTRSRKGVLTTAAGERMYAHGARLLAQQGEILEDVRRDEAEPSGQLRISVPAGIADDVLVPVLGRFLQQYTRVRLDVLATDSLVDLRQAGIDIALRFGWVQTGDFIARKLATYEEFVVAAPAYLNNREPVRALADLARHNWVGYAGFGGATQKLEMRDANGRLQHVVVECRLRTSNAPSQKAWTVAGIGLTRLPRFLVEPELASGHLVRVLPSHRFDGPSLYAVYLTDRYRSAAAKAMLLFLEECLSASIGGGQGSGSPFLATRSGAASVESLGNRRK